MKKPVFFIALIITFISIQVSADNYIGAKRKEYNPEVLCIRNTCFPYNYSLDGVDIPLKGTGHVGFFAIDVYTAAFYSDDERKCLVIHYHSKIKRSLFVETASKQILKNPEVNFDKIKDRIDKFHAVYKDVNAGDNYTLEYSSGRTRLLLNGVEQIVVPGEDFANAYFGIWLSKYPLDKRLKRKLLGKKRRS